MNRVYFDYAATTPTDPEVLNAMKPFFFEKFGNATSPHAIGREAQKALEDAREGLAKFLGIRPEEVFFTSGATESNNQAIFGLARALKEKGNHIIVSSIEHHSVLEPVHFLSQEGFNITALKVNEEGVVDPEDVKGAITEKTILVAIMHANNVIGSLQPIEEIGKITKEKNVSLLVDAVQSIGHIPVNVNKLGANIASLSAHKFYGPKGMGALYIRKGTKVRPFLLGGDQEHGMRASTQNVAGAVGLAKAVSLCEEKMPEEVKVQTKWRYRMFEEIPKRIEGVKINGSLTKRLPQNVHFSFEGISGESLLMALDMEGIAASMGSACTSGALKPSHVLKAIGLSDALALGSLRLTFGRWMKNEDIEYLVQILPKIVKRLRK